MIHDHFNNHVSELKYNLGKLSKLDLKILDIYFNNPEKTVRDMYKSFAKKRCKPMSYFVMLLKGLTQRSPSNTVVFECLERAMSYSGIQTCEITAEINKVFGTVFCEKAGRKIPAITYRERQDIPRRIERHAKLRGGTALIIPSGASVDTLEALRDVTMKVSLESDYLMRKILDDSLREHGIRTDIFKHSAILARISQLSAALPNHVRLKPSQVLRQFDEAIAMVNQREQERSPDKS